MLKNILLITVVLFFAINMGASGVAPSFAATYGGKLIKKKVALIIFSVFVILGALILGRGVALTIGKALIAQKLLSTDAVLTIILFFS